MEAGMVHKFIKDGFILKIVIDDEPMNPRYDYEPLGHFQMQHRNYDFDDDFKNEYDLFDTIERSRYYKEKWNIRDYGLMDEEFQKILYKCRDIIALPVYMYDHSGITIQTFPFNCQWDSGQIGWTWITYDEVKNEYSGWKNITTARLKRIQRYLQDEIKVLDNYLTGNVFGYIIIDPDDNEVDSCWGYNGDWENNCYPEAKEALEYQIQKYKTKPIVGQLP